MAEMSGIPIDSLRYYDKLGIVCPKRGENGYRYYDERDYGLLQYVSVMKYGHFTLSEIKIIVTSLDVESSESCNQINRDIFLTKRAELLEMAKNYRSIAKLIEAMLPMIDGTEAYSQHKGELDAFIQKLYVEIGGANSGYGRSL